MCQKDHYCQLLFIIFEEVFVFFTGSFLDAGWLRLRSSLESQVEQLSGHFVGNGVVSGFSKEGQELSNTLLAGDDFIHESSLDISVSNFHADIALSIYFRIEGVDVCQDALTLFRSLLLCLLDDVEHLSVGQLKQSLEADILGR